ncbi:hypothetical protein ACLI1A_11195 [Flavobacterium sp. RHBU_3]|uniref:hypothetical protein n=1 Tax=Flavobacterium sp. RHBU_3 TaxID=3391184 RepID=UPI0039847948
MKIKTLIATFSLIALVGISACSLNSDDPYCFVRTGTPILGVSGATTTTINTPITFSVGVQISNSCGAFNSFSETSGFPKDITAIVDYNGCSCDQTESSLTEEYTFTATAAGTYELRFQTDDTEAPIVKTITVTNE